MSNIEKLAVNGGPKAVGTLKPRFHFGVEEKEAAMRLFDRSIETGNAFGYNGPEEEALGKEFAEFLGGGYADGVNGGTNAVFVALRALEPKPFSEVIVGAVTDAGGMMPIVLNNCIPVVCDTMPGRYNIGPEQVEACITPLTSAIIVPHIGGEPADIKGIMEVANRHGIPVIEDCAQAHGAKVDGQYVGTFGTYGAFSVMFGKHFCTGGQGGMVFSKTEAYFYQKNDFTYLTDGGALQVLPIMDYENILVKNIYLSFGSDIINVADDTLRIYTNDSLHYNGDDLDAHSNDKGIGLLWYNKNENE